MDPLQRALDNLRTMFEVRRTVLSSLTRTSMLISMNIEATHILAYLMGLQERWKKVLPFREHASVNLKEWAEEFTNWGYHINNETPSGYRDHYSLFMPDDDMGMAIVKNFAKWQATNDGERLRKLFDIAKPDRNHVSEFKNNPESFISFHLFSALYEPECAIANYEADDIRSDLSQTLDKLVSVLNSLQTLQEIEVMNASYDERCSKLFEYVANNYCKAEKERARMEVEEFMGTLDVSNAINELQLASRMTISELSKDNRYTSLANFVDLQRNIMEQTPGIGRYLYQNRKDLDNDALQHLMGKILRLDQYQLRLNLLRANKGKTDFQLSEEDQKLCEGRELTLSFNEKLREDLQSKVEFYKIMDCLHAEMKQASIRTEERINWLDIQKALTELCLFTSPSDSAFADAMHELFPNSIKAESYVKALQRTYEKMTCDEAYKSIHKTITKTVMDKLQPVMAILRRNNL